MSDSLRPRGATRLLRPWDFLGKSTGEGCHFLLQGIFPTQGSNPGLPHCRQTLYRLSHQGSLTHTQTGLPWWLKCGSKSKEFACNAGDPGLIPGSGWSLEKEMRTHFSILAERIPWTEEPGRIQSMRLQRVRQDWVTNSFTHKLTVYFDETSQTKTIWMKSDKLTIVYLLVQSLSHIQPFVTPGTVAHHVPLSRVFPRQEYWSVFPFPYPEDFPDPQVESTSPALADGFCTVEPPGKPMFTYFHVWSHHFTNYNMSYHL